MAETETTPPAIAEALRVATAKTLRKVAFWGSIPQENFIAIAEQVEQDETFVRGDLASYCCPVCEEVECDSDCPLASLRAGL